MPLFQNESKSGTFHIKMSSACSFIFMQIKVIFIRMVSHFAFETEAQGTSEKAYSEHQTSALDVFTRHQSSVKFLPYCLNHTRLPLRERIPIMITRRCCLYGVMWFHSGVYKPASRESFFYCATQCSFISKKTLNDRAFIVTASNPGTCHPCPMKNLKPHVKIFL